MLYFFSTIFFSLLPNIMTQTSSCLNTNQTICNGTFRYDNAYHTQYECSTQIYSSFELPSCYNGDPTMSVYWFWYDDVCKFNDTIDTIFAVVPIDGTRVCQDSPKLHITYESCERDYDFQRETMTIKNITNLTQQKYICFLSTNRVPMNFTSGRIYSINVLGEFFSLFLQLRKKDFIVMKVSQK